MTETQLNPALKPAPNTMPEQDIPGHEISWQEAWKNLPQETKRRIEEHILLEEHEARLKIQEKLINIELWKTRFLLERSRRDLAAYQAHIEWRKSARRGSERKNLFFPGPKDTNLETCIQQPDTHEPANLDVKFLGKAKQGKTSTEETSPEGITLNWFGEDLIITDPERGISVIADGISGASGGKENADTRKVAGLASRALYQLLRTFPEQLTPAVWEQEAMGFILAELKKIKATGGVMLAGYRYLAATDQLVLFDLGNCQIALDNGTGWQNLKTTPTQKIGHEDPISLVKDKKRGAYISTNKNVVLKNILTIINLRELRSGDTPLRLRLASDGLQENTGADLVHSPLNWESLNVEDVPNANDDFSLITTELPNIH